MGGSCYFDKRSKRWYVKIYWDGKPFILRRHPLTNEPFFDKRSASKQLSRIQTEIDEGSFHPKFWQPESPMLIGNYYLEWLDGKQASAKTLRDYKGYFKNHVAPAIGDKDLRKIRMRDIEMFYRDLQVSQKTKYNILAALKTMFHDAYRNEDIGRIPPFPRLSMPDTVPEYISLDQQEALLSAIPERDRPIFAIGMEYGLRVQEARAIQRDCITEDTLIIKRAFADNALKETKTGQWREVELTRYTRDILESIEPHLSPFVFVRWDGKPYTNKNMNAIWHEAEKASGIEIKLQKAFRHSAACQLLDQGEDLDLVRQLLGHKNASMTRRYARRSNPVVTSALEKRRAQVIKIRGRK